MARPLPALDGAAHLRWESVPWEDLIPRLVAYARYKMSPSPLLDGRDCQDFVKEAIVQTIDGRAGWDPMRCEIEPHLRVQVVRLIAKARRRESLLPRKDRNTRAADEQNASPLDTVADPRPGHERSLHFDETRQGLLAAMAGDPLLERLLRLRLDEGLVKRRELARALGISETDYDALKKRFCRRVRHFLAKFGKEGGIL